MSPFDSRAVPQRPYPALAISLARTLVRLQMSAFVDSEDCYENPTLLALAGL
jgi:hypothetical protein